MCCFVSAPQSIAMEPMLKSRNSKGQWPASVRIASHVGMLVIETEPVFLETFNILRPRLEGVTLGIAGTIEERRSNWCNKNWSAIRNMCPFWFWSHWNQTYHYPATFEDEVYKLQFGSWEWQSPAISNMQDLQSCNLRSLILCQVEATWIVWNSGFENHLEIWTKGWKSI